MSRIVLLHGFAVHLTAPVVRPPFGPSASMEVFDDLVTTGEAKVFPWGLKKQVSPVNLLNPTLIQTLYKEELDLVRSETLHQQLKSFLEQEQPQRIVCHSMGCVLLQQYLEKNTLPNSVTYIILIQSDLASDTLFKTSVPVHHLYCPWDPTLLLSSMINKSFRAGLVQSRQSNTHNILFPLYKIPNLHTSSIRDKKLIDIIESFS